MTESLVKQMDQLFIFQGASQTAQAVSATRHTFSFECLPRSALLTLPEELLEILFEYMDRDKTIEKGRNISRLMRTCRAAYRIGLPVLYQNPVLSERQIPMWQKLPDRLFPLVQTLETSLSSSHYVFFCYYLKRMSGLVGLSLNFKFVSYLTTQVFRALPPTLRSIALKGNFDTEEHILQSKMFERLPALESFRLLEPLLRYNLAALFAFPDIGKLLTEISINESNYIALEEKSSSLPALRRVKLFLNAEDNPTRAVRFLAKLPQVTVLSLQNLEKMSGLHKRTQPTIYLLRNLPDNIEWVEIGGDIFANSIAPQEYEPLREALARRPPGSIIKVTCFAPVEKQAQETECGRVRMEKINFWKSIPGAVVTLKKWI